MSQDGLDTQMTMPEFTIKAKDMFAIQTLRFHRQLCIEANLQHQADEEQRAIDEMLLWRDHNRRLIKYPDHKHVPAAIAHTPETVRSGQVGMSPCDNPKDHLPHDWNEGVNVLMANSGRSSVASIPVWCPGRNRRG